MNIGNLIKRRRIDLDLTQVDLANNSGVTQSMISKLESGKEENVSIELLRKLAKAMKCLVVDLLPEDDKRK